jgi:hypothetical protein
LSNKLTQTFLHLEKLLSRRYKNLVMARRRTKKQKSKAKHQFLLKWEPATKESSTKAKKPLSEPAVKGQIKTQASLGTKAKAKLKFADFQAKNGSLALIKRDIVKSLFLASLVLALEVMLYLAWT